MQCFLLTSFFSDSLMTEFQNLANTGEWEANGWPNCAYTVSKVGVNVYTRILQREFTEEGSGNVVNSIHPGTKHSKIQQQSVIPLEVRLNHIVLIRMLCILSLGWSLGHRQLCLCPGH